MTLGKQESGVGSASPQPGASPIAFQLDPGSGVPTYLQLVQQVEQALRIGYLGRGDQLPRIKEVVADLAINPNTVLKAYRELEHRGLAVGRPGQGTFIAGTLPRVAVAEQNSLRAELASWLRSAKAAGLDDAGVTALFASTLRELSDEGAGEVA
jgi:GntR family transcriptional regulator